jgi:hypothetical protein
MKMLAGSPVTDPWLPDSRVPGDMAIGQPSNPDSFWAGHTGDRVTMRQSPSGLIEQFRIVKSARTGQNFGRDPRLSRYPTQAD